MKKKNDEATWDIPEELKRAFDEEEFLILMIKKLSNLDLVDLLLYYADKEIDHYDLLLGEVLDRMGGTD